MAVAAEDVAPVETDAVVLDAVDELQELAARFAEHCAAAPRERPTMGRKSADPSLVGLRCACLGDDVLPDPAVLSGGRCVAAHRRRLRPIRRSALLAPAAMRDAEAESVAVAEAAGFVERFAEPCAAVPRERLMLGRKSADRVRAGPRCALSEEDVVVADLAATDADLAETDADLVVRAALFVGHCVVATRRKPMLPRKSADLVLVAMRDAVEAAAEDAHRHSSVR